MHELTRLAYLQVLGIDSYVSRGPLAGAAATRRLVAVRQSARADRQSPRAELPASADSPVTDGAIPRRAQEAPAVSAEAAVAAAPARAVPRCSFAAVVAGRWLWLEGLGTMPLASDQVALIGAMAHALRLHAGEEDAAAQQPVVARFDWPMHNNPQLDNSVEAGRASLGAFVTRRLQEQGCRALVLLGDAAEGWLASSEIEGIAVVRTASTAAILQNPGLKPRVWRDLQPLRSAAG